MKENIMDISIFNLLNSHNFSKLHNVKPTIRRYYASHL